MPPEAAHRAEREATSKAVVAARKAVVAKLRRVIAKNGLNGPLDARLIPIERGTDAEFVAALRERRGLGHETRAHRGCDAENAGRVASRGRDG